MIDRQIVTDNLLIRKTCFGLLKPVEDKTEGQVKCVRCKEFEYPEFMIKIKRRKAYKTVYVNMCVECNRIISKRK